MASSNNEENLSTTSKEEPEKLPPASKPESLIDSSVEQIRKYIASKLGILDDDKSDTEPTPSILSEPTIDGIVDYIKREKCHNIITLAGAGISTSAGIPDFRSPGSGLYHNLQKYNLPEPQAIFELEYFKDNPKPFFTLAKELYPGCFKPTVCHYFLRILNEKKLLLRHYTQNIDTLERVAGIPGDKLVEAHGTFNTGHCLECNEEYSQEFMKNKIFIDEIPICKKCPGIVKPDIVFFGENLPNRFHECLLDDFKKCDLLIIMGSSLVVQPFASLIERVPQSCPRLLINREKTGERSRITRMLNLCGGMDFDSENSRDVAWLGDCDDLCIQFADKLGWKNELVTLMTTEHELIENEAKEKKTTTTQ